MGENAHIVVGGDPAIIRLSGWRLVEEESLASIDQAFLLQRSIEESSDSSACSGIDRRLARPHRSAGILVLNAFVDRHPLVVVSDPDRPCFFNLFLGS